MLFYVLFVFVFYVLFACKCVLYHCHRVLTQLQLTNISYSGKHSVAIVPYIASDYGDMNWIILAKDRVHIWAVLNSAVKLRFL